MGIITQDNTSNSMMTVEMMDNSDMISLPHVSWEMTEEEEEDRTMSPHYYYIPLNTASLDLYNAVVEAVALETKYQPALVLPPAPRDSCEISSNMRTGSCQVLRCLKVFYELPSDAFFLAVNCMDRFLTRMRAKPKHLPCIAVASFSVAAQELAAIVGNDPPTRESISLISQSKCTPNDVSRMEDIIRSKLELYTPSSTAHNDGRLGQLGDLPITPIYMLKLLYSAHTQLLASHFPKTDVTIPPLLSMIHALEMVVCDTAATNTRSSVLVLALMNRMLANTSMMHATCLQSLFNVCKVSESTLTAAEEIVSRVLTEYNNTTSSSNSLYTKQRLVWKLSNRTLRQLKPISKLNKMQRMPSLTEDKEDTTTYATPLYNIAWRLPRQYKVRGPRNKSKPLEQDKVEDMETEEEFNSEEQKTSEETESMEVVPTPQQDEKSSHEQQENDNKEKSYCQVAKKMRESPTTSISVRRMVLAPCMDTTTLSCLSTSPLSKITVTPSLLTPSPAVKNLTRALTEDSDDVSAYYCYHYARFVGVLEGIDGDVTDSQQMHPLTATTKPTATTPKICSKRKKTRRGVKLSLSTQLTYEDHQTELNSSSSEEEMDTDYEKQFPPLPLPRTPHPRLAALRKKNNTATHINKKKKKKKGSEPMYSSSKCKGPRRKRAAVQFDRMYTVATAV